MSSVKILFFAIAKERVGCDQIVLNIGDDTTLQSLKEQVYVRFPDLRPLEPYLRWAVNERFVHDEAFGIKPGDEVALIPPVSGGDVGYLTNAPISRADLIERVSGPEHGAIVTFVGQVRNQTLEHEVTHLVYEAYSSMANRVILEIIQDAEEQWPAVQIDMRHRLGHVPLAEASVIIAVGSAHRADAFEACRYVIERLKTDVPIFKKEFRTDGSVWVGQGS